MVRDVFRLLYKPSTVFHEQRPNARLIPALINFGLTGADIGVVGILFFFLTTNALSTNDSIPHAFIEIISYVFGEGLYLLILFPFVAAVVLTIFFSFFLFIVWKVSTVMGGSGTWVQNMYLFSLLFLPIAIATFMVNLIVIDPFIGTVISLVWGLYILYLFITAISIANTIAWSRAALVFFTPLVTIALVSFWMKMI
jgi:hypothetical protein